MASGHRRRRASQRGISAVEAAIGFAIVGTALAMVVPSCIRATRLSHTSEATENLRKLAVSYAAVRNDPSKPAPSSAPLTPADVPRGAPREDSAGTWDHPTWRALEFSIAEPHWYSYRVDVDPAPNVPMRATANGDLDGDGVLSTYSVEVGREGKTFAPRSGLMVERELE